MFEGDCTDTCAGTFLLMSMGGQAEGLVCAEIHYSNYIISNQIDQIFLKIHCSGAKR
jgi:hypothetical protein